MAVGHQEQREAGGRITRKEDLFMGFRKEGHVGWKTGKEGRKVQRVGRFECKIRTDAASDSSVPPLRPTQAPQLL